MLGVEGWDEHILPDGQVIITPALNGKGYFFSRFFGWFFSRFLDGWFFGWFLDGRFLSRGGFLGSTTSR